MKREILAVAMDVDGVLTDGGFWWGPNGEEFKRFCFLDVMGLSRARRAGLRFALISGEASPLVDRFAEKLAIEDVYKGIKDKASALRSFSEKINIPLENIGFIGDDVNDLPAMEIAGFSAAPPTAHRSVLQIVDYIAQHPGGNGAVRDVMDYLMLQMETQKAPR